MRIPADTYFSYKDSQGKLRIEDDLMLATADLNGGESGQGLQHALNKKLAEEEKIRDNTPQRNEEDLTKDILFIMGMIHGLKWVLSFPDECRRIINENEKLKEE